MGYNITIGEAKIGFYDDGSGFIYAEMEFHDQAPVCDNHLSIFDYKNERHPSYNNWHDFATACGLYGLFFNKPEGIMSGEEGGSIKKLTKEHLSIIEEAYDKCIQNNQINEGHKHRLRWLKYWVSYAVNNCTNPILSF